MSKFERIVPDKRRVNCLPAVKRDVKNVLASLAERKHRKVPESSPGNQTAF